MVSGGVTHLIAARVFISLTLLLQFRVRDPTPDPRGRRLSTSTHNKMHETVQDRRAGCKRARAGAGAITMRAVLLVLLAAGPHVPSSDALKLASISEDRGHLGVGLLRAVEVVRGRYERAWALISAAEPTAEELETALELLQVRDLFSVVLFYFGCAVLFRAVFCIGLFLPCGPHRHT